MERLANGSAAQRFVVGGTVPSRADELRLVFVDGGTRSYALEGHILQDAPEFRLVAFSLGDRMYRRFEILDDGIVLEAADIRPRDIERMACFARFPYPAGTRELDPELTECLRAADG